MANKAKVATEVKTLNEEVATEEVKTLVNQFTVISNLKHNGTTYNV